LSSDLEIRIDSLDSRTGHSNSDLRIGEYDFFATDHESPYRVAAEQLEKGREELKSRLFTGSIPKDKVDSVLMEKTLGILETPSEYTLGRFDESSSYIEDVIIPAVLITAACAVSFFAAKLWSRYKRKRAEACTSQSQ
jgi:hypothetical protein